MFFVHCKCKEKESAKKGKQSSPSPKKSMPKTLWSDALDESKCPKVVKAMQDQRGDQRDERSCICSRSKVVNHGPKVGIKQERFSRSSPSIEAT